MADVRPVPPWARDVPMPDSPVGRLDAQDPPIAMPIPGPGMPRELGLDIVAWLIPTGVIVATVLAILCGALWR